MNKILLSSLFLSFVLTSASYSANHYWLGAGALAQKKESYMRQNPTYTMITFGLGSGFGGSNLIFLELAYGLPSGKTSDGSKSRMSIVRTGIEKYFSFLSFNPYIGLAGGTLIRTIDASKRSTNWQVGGIDYDVEGIKKRSSINYMVEINFGIRFLRDLISDFSFDWNTISVIYSQKRFQYMTAINLVYSPGGR